MSEWGFFIDNRPWELSRSLFIRTYDRQSGKASLVAPFTLTALEYATAVPNDSPTLRDGGMEMLVDRGGDIHGFLQAAMDAAWKEGLRPEGYTPPADPAPELAALRYHLEDMRTLAKLRDRQA